MLKYAVNFKMQNIVKKTEDANASMTTAKRAGCGKHVKIIKTYWETDITVEEEIKKKACD